MRRCCSRMLGAVFTFLLVQGFAAQDSSQRPVPPGMIRVRVRLVPVDVIVTDRNNQPVRGLKQQDFELLENGRPQEIRHFVVQDFEAGTPPAGREKTATGEGLVPQAGRTFLIMMARGHYQTPFRNVDALIRFVREELVPQDKVAVFAYNRATDFTTDHASIVSVLERYKAAHDKIESWLEMQFSGLAAIYGSKEIPAFCQVEIDKIFGSRRAASQVTPGVVRTATSMGRDAITTLNEGLIPADNPSRNAWTKAEADAITDLPLEQYLSTYGATFQDVQNLYTCIEYMRYMEGEKHLLFFTPSGLFLPKLEYEESIAAVANDARVVIDTFQTGGMAPALTLDAVGVAQPTPTWSRTFAMSSIRGISSLTGGSAAVYEDVGRSLTRMNERTRVEYLLGYYPKDENWNGKYRRIDVKVKRPGLKVSFRGGYYANDTLQPYDRELSVAYSRISAAAGYGSDLLDIPFQVSAAEVPNPLGPPMIKASLSIGPEAIGWGYEGSIRTAKLYTAVIYPEPKTKSAGFVWGNTDLKLNEEQYQNARSSGMPLAIYVPLKQRKQLLKVIVYDPATDRVGSHQIMAR